LLPAFDAAMSRLLLDLEDRGLLDETLVMCLSEHGRTPKINNRKRGGGRDHWSQAYSVMLAGAGIQPGTVIGASDAQGAFVKDQPVSPEDILATMYHLKGIAPDTTIPDRLRRPVRLTENGIVINDLLG
jgi:arylsulfatase A-like enzyme